MSNKKETLKNAKMPLSSRAKKKLDDWLNENVNVPLAQRGMPDTGAAISAAVSAGGELLIPENLADVAMAVTPGGYIAKAAKKGYKAIKKAKPDDRMLDAVENVLNYKKADAAQKATSTRPIDRLKPEPGFTYDKFNMPTKIKKKKKTNE